MALCSPDGESSSLSFRRLFVFVLVFVFVLWNVEPFGKTKDVTWGVVPNNNNRHSVLEKEGKNNNRRDDIIVVLLAATC